jgi:geranylgeranylglycerol-phosphate geranylgeranyltransferase
MKLSWICFFILFRNVFPLPIRSIVNKSATVLFSKQRPVCDAVKYPFYPNDCNIYRSLVQFKIKADPFIKKGSAVLRLIRSENIAPTIVLLLAGGWISSPSWKNMRSPQFLSSGLITLMVLSASMIINDIFDIEIDKTNNPSRPLISGEITKKEAFYYYITLLGASEILSLFFLPKHIQYLVHMIILVVSVYTPYLKPIPFIKNLTCAFIISFSVFFAGAAASSGFILAPLSQILSRFIFLGSLQSELLLDMRDYEGDLENSIRTVPVIFGLSKTHLVATAILYTNIFTNTFHIMSIYGFRYGLYFMGICYSLFLDMEKIAEYDYSRKATLIAVKKTIGPMILVTAYLCMLRSFI